MNLLYKRPLATVLLAFTVGSVFSFLLPFIAKLVFSSVFTVFAILFFAKRRVLLGATFVSLILALLLSLYTFSIRPSALSAYTEDEVYFSATVVDTSVGDYGVSVVADITALNGEKPPVYTQNRITFLLTNENATALKIGDCFTASAHFSLLPMNELYALSKGCVATPEDIQFYSYIPRERVSLSEHLAVFRAQIASRIQTAVPAESGEFMTELLLGEHALSSDIRLAFRRNGISHLLALSGMHLSLLSIFVLWFLERIRVPRTVRNVIVLLFVLSYVALTGFLPSMVRSGIMTAVMLMGFIVGRHYDSMTALSLAAAGMILVTPYVVTDVGFLLSVSATFGLLAAMEMTAVLDTAIKNRFLLSTVKSVIFTVSATLAALPVLAPVFGEISLLSIPANLLFAFPVNFEILLSLLTAVCPIAPIAFIAEKNGELIIWLARFTSSAPNTMLSLSSPEKYTTVAAMAFLFFFLLSIPLRRRHLAYLPLLFMLALVSAFQIKDSVLARQNVTVSYAATYSSDAVCFSTRGSAVALLSGNSSPLTSAIYDAHKVGVTELSALILCDLDTGLPQRLDRVCGNIRVHSLYLPLPKSTAELSVCDEILSFSQKNRITVRYYQDGDLAHIGGMSLAFELGDTSTSYPVLIAVKAENAKLVYLSADYHKSGDREMAGTVIGESDVVIIGKHRKNAIDYLPYRCFSPTLSHVIIGDKNLRYWQGIEAVNALENAEVTITPALYRCKIKR